MSRLNVKTSDGKYTVVMEDDGSLHALRHDQPWRDCVGDGLVLTLAQDLETSRDAFKEMERSYMATLESIHEKYELALSFLTELQKERITEMVDEKRHHEKMTKRAKR